MAEYIDREILIRNIENDTRRILFDKGSALHYVRSAPAADVVPVKHGKWIHNDDWWEFICTNCRKGIGNIQEYKYCPNCGVIMDLKEETK